MKRLILWILPLACFSCATTCYNPHYIIYDTPKTPIEEADSAEDVGDQAPLIP